MAIGVALASIVACTSERGETVPVEVQDPAPDFVADCRPCRFLIDSSLPPFAFSFEIDSTPVGRSVTAIEVRRSDERQAERLQVHGMMPEAPSEKFFFGATDLDGDGNLDLMIATSRGVANTYADYWRFIPASGTFAYLGNYPELSVDSASKRLKTYERGGAGGRLFQAREWKFDGDSLLVMREEVQEAADKAGEFVRIVRERTDVGGQSVLREVQRERLKERP